MRTALHILWRSWRRSRRDDGASQHGAQKAKRESKLQNGGAATGHRVNRVNRVNIRELLSFGRLDRPYRQQQAISTPCSRYASTAQEWARTLKRPSLNVFVRVELVGPINVDDEHMGVEDCCAWVPIRSLTATVPQVPRLTIRGLDHSKRRSGLLPSGRRRSGRCRPSRQQLHGWLRYTWVILIRLDEQKMELAHV